MKHYLAAFLIAMSAWSVADAQATSTPEKELVTAVGEVDLKGGITFVQANAIAQFYYQHHISGCGFADLAVDRGSRWEITPRIGFVGTPSMNPIIIEKHTGQISRKDGPTFNISTIAASQEAPQPQPIHKDAVGWPRDLPREAHSTTIQVEFVVLPSGTTSDVKFKHSSGRRECDRAVRGAVERWRYAPRKTSIAIVESLETCTY